MSEFVPPAVQPIDECNRPYNGDPSTLRYIPHRKIDLEMPVYVAAEAPKNQPVTRSATLTIKAPGLDINTPVKLFPNGSVEEEWNPHHGSNAVSVPGFRGLCSGFPAQRFPEGEIK